MSAAYFFNCEIFQSTHPARGATLPHGNGAGQPTISIHAPRERCDTLANSKKESIMYFNPRTPREVRRYYKSKQRYPVRFQSTHPARGATNKIINVRQSLKISIHAPRERCDLFACSRASSLLIFQSTHPARGATLHVFPPSRDTAISIHAPRERCDLMGHANVLITTISIHAPRERCDEDKIAVFLHWWISIHAPRERCDLNRFIIYYMFGIFQSTHPARGATFRKLSRH